LVVAQQILESPDLPKPIRDRLCQNETVCGAFFFGHIAPDVQVISREPRASTHFFALPPTNSIPAYSHMLMTHLQLAQPSMLAAAHAAFVAGYISHLLLDELWVREIFFPVFGPAQVWGERRERLLLHNVLRAWLDRRGLPLLWDGAGDLLRCAEPNGWLPFVSNQHLAQWRDLVADQLVPGAAIRTVEIFANRARIPNDEFLALLDPRVMDERVFSHISLVELNRYYEWAVTGIHDLIVQYLNGCTWGKSV
jgi:hypothetical protein